MGVKLRSITLPGGITRNYVGKRETMGKPWVLLYETENDPQRVYFEWRRIHYAPIGPVQPAVERRME